MEDLPQYLSIHPRVVRDPRAGHGLDTLPGGPTWRDKMKETNQHKNCLKPFHLPNPTSGPRTMSSLRNPCMIHEYDEQGEVDVYFPLTFPVFLLRLPSLAKAGTGKKARAPRRLTVSRAAGRHNERKLRPPHAVTWVQAFYCGIRGGKRAAGGCWHLGSRRAGVT